MGNKIEKISDEELTRILEYVDPSFKFFRAIAAKWAKQYADNQDGPAIACWAKQNAGQYVTFAEELRPADDPGSESDFTDWLDSMFPDVEDFVTGKLTDPAMKKAHLIEAAQHDFNLRMRSLQDAYTKSAAELHEQLLNRVDEIQNGERE